MFEVSVFHNYAQWVENISCIEVIKQIQVGNYKDPIEAIRKLIAEGKSKEADKLKKSLPAFTPSGTFENGRKADLLAQYSDFIILDLDKLNPTELEEAKKIVAIASYTFAAFISPSGNGLKIIVPVNSTAEHHKTAFLQVVDYYEQALQLIIDPSGKDVSRLCFMSYDPDCYLNINANLFNVSIEMDVPRESKEENKKVPEPLFNESLEDETNWLEVFGSCVKFTELKLTYLEGNRNNFVHLLACNCNRIGIPESIAESFILNNFDLADSEIKASIKSAYSNIVEFGKFNLNESAPNGLFCDTLDNMILRAQNAPKLKFLWSGIMVGSFGFVFGPSKSGKTIFCENLALCIAAGFDSFIGLDVEVKPKRVLFISLEEYWQPRTERNQKQLEHIGIKLGEYYTIVDEKFPRLINTKDDWILLENHIKKTEAEVVFIDSMSRMYSGSIEDSNTAKEISLKLRELANNLKITLIVIHHTPKQMGRPLTIDSLAGSRILAQEADFMIGISKTPDANRYMKEVSFRYKQENDETVSTFTINGSAWLEFTNNVTENSLLKSNDGREDSTNTDLIFEFISEKSLSPQGYASTRDLMETFIDNDVMTKPTLYSQIKKLLSKGKIITPDRSIYKVKQSI